MRIASFDTERLKETSNNYLSFYLTVNEDHSMAFEWNVYMDEHESPDFTLRFGLLGHIKTFVCIDLGWLDAKVLYPEPIIGGLKNVCHGGRVERERVTRHELVSLPCFHEISVEMSDEAYSKERPKGEPLPYVKLVDRFGQNSVKHWTGKINSEEELENSVKKQVESLGADAVLQNIQYTNDDWSEYGGWKKKRLTDGSGFFSKFKENGRWWLVDPLGYAFFSVGADCVRPSIDGRIDCVEKWLEWLPDENDELYSECFGFQNGRKDDVRKFKSFDYLKANIIRAFGKDWYESWKGLVTAQLKKNGFNTLGNWSEPGLLGHCGIPYVDSLPEFPSTKVNIFRDFPDVLSDEYKNEAKRCARKLAERRDDPYMIGYFLRNEPSWAFVDNLVIADEVLYNPQPTACKAALIEELKEKYKNVEALNDAWNCSFEGFDDLNSPQKEMSKRSAAALKDLRSFSRRLVRAYIEIPSRACREEDQNHMILGMRWAWISDPDLVTGWENFDVFSINCYGVDPTNAISNIANHGVDLPIVIGEFHFGALDKGLTATGLEGVKTQADRGLAFRYYCERTAAHPFGVGCHYFQFYDQFMLGRFDGENYNIGLFDTCMQPYDEMLAHVKECTESIYEVASGEKKPTSQKPQTIPMIAY